MTERLSVEPYRFRAKDGRLHLWYGGHHHLCGQKRRTSDVPEPEGADVCRFCEEQWSTNNPLRTLRVEDWEDPDD